MNYFENTSAIYLITITINLFYAALFVYHFVKKDTNKSIMILSGCLCLAMALLHSYSTYLNSLDKSSLAYYYLTINHYLILIAEIGVTVLAIFLCHHVFDIRPSPVVTYIYRCALFSIVINGAMYIDIMVLDNRTPNSLWSFYSMSSIVVDVYMFFTVLVARKWNEVYHWLVAAHGR